jgi:hypothetical protein
MRWFFPFALLLAAACNQQSPDVPDREPSSSQLAGQAMATPAPELTAKPAGKVRQLVEIPKAFHGEWSQKPRLCGTDGWDAESRIWVDASSVGYFESVRDVVGVTETSAGLKLRFKPMQSESGEGVYDPDELTDPPDELTLSKDGQVLNGHFRKCPIKE